MIAAQQHPNSKSSGVSYGPACCRQHMWYCYTVSMPREVAEHLYYSLFPTVRCFGGLQRNLSFGKTMAPCEAHIGEGAVKYVYLPRRGPHYPPVNEKALNSVPLSHQIEA